MNNETYLESIGVQSEDRQRCLEAMAKYGDNHWWEPDVDGETYAYYALKEALHLDAAPNPGRLGRGLMKLCNRFVHPVELVANKDALLAEVERAWKYRVGCTSDAERAERVNEGARNIIEHMQRKNIPIIVIAEE